MNREQLIALANKHLEWKSAVGGLEAFAAAIIEIEAPRIMAEQKYWTDIYKTALYSADIIGEVYRNNLITDAIRKVKHVEAE